MNQQTILITGGGQGIGRKLTQRFLEKDFAVSVLEFDSVAADELKADFVSDKLFVRKGDCSVENDVRDWIAETKQMFGGITHLIHNAGIACNKPLKDLSLSEWNRVLSVNLTSAFLSVKYAEEDLRKNKGAVILIASTRAFMSEPNTEAYSAAKGGLIALTHALAVSFGPDVRVNSISPGWIDVSDLKKKTERKTAILTEADHLQHPAGRVGNADDIASLALFLLSNESGFITGQNFIADGGMTKKMIYV